MVRRILIIALLAAGLAVLLFYKPWAEPPAIPRFYDRLPEADIIGKADAMELARSLMATTYNYKIPLREFISPEFVLSQGKANGLDIQSPIYFFANQSKMEIKDWGAMAMVRDSAKLREGILSVKNIIGLRDTIIAGHLSYVGDDLVLSFDKDWFLVSNVSGSKKFLKHILSAKRNGISPRWRKFIDSKIYEDKSIVASVKASDLKEYGIETMYVAASNDSSSVTIHSQLNYLDTMSVSMRTGGVYLNPQEYTRRLVNVNLDIEKLRDNPDDPLYKLLGSLGEKIHFPLKSFMDTWDGNLAYRQGGIENVKEKYISTELDENFNVTEVVKYKNIKVSGFALYLNSIGENLSLIDELMAKGILTKEDRKVRMLFAPPMYMNYSDTSLYFHTLKWSPQLNDGSTQSVVWDIQNTPVTFQLDSTKVKTAYGKVIIPLDRVVEEELDLQ